MAATKTELLSLIMLRSLGVIIAVGYITSLALDAYALPAGGGQQDSLGRLRVNSAKTKAYYGGSCG
jgi:hypothetical protein